MYKTVKSLDEYNSVLKDNTGVLMYFSNGTCNVCKVLKPQVIEMLKENYPKISFCYVDMYLTPEISSQNGVFTTPTIVVYFYSNETIRKSKYIGVGKLKQSIEKQYNLIFS